jgi:hypothetical protein
MTSFIQVPVLEVNTSSDFKNNNNNMNLYNLTSTQNDLLYKDLRTVQSMQPGAYDISDFRPNYHGENQAREIQLSQPAINFNSGHSGGKNGYLIDTDSNLRFEELTNKKYVNQLHTRFALTAPYIRGKYNPNVESILISGEKTNTKRPCNVLSGKSLLSHYYTPMIDSLRETVQKTDHIIQEDVYDNWVRGGMGTRQYMKNLDYNSNN